MRRKIAFAQDRIDVSDVNQRGRDVMRVGRRIILLLAEKELYEYAVMMNVQNALGPHLNGWIMEISRGKRQGWEMFTDVRAANLGFLTKT